MKVNDLVDKIQKYSEDADIRMIVDAYLYSAQSHTGQKRKSGEAYLTHPLAVAGILADMRMDVDTIATGLLHDTMEDCLVTHEDLTARFGKDVADLVDGVTKIGKLKFRSKQEAQAENFRKMFLAMSKDIRVIVVKLADRLHNMQTMEHMKPDRQKAISQETMDIFAPIANRIGFSKMKSELEDYCFRYLEPELYNALKEQLDALAVDHQQFIQSFSEHLQTVLEEKGVKCTVKGRVKELFSIHRKMNSQNKDFDQIHDLLAFRVFVEDLGQCYATLGLIHGMYPHHPNRLKDYIAQPKSNGYQSLHTLIIAQGHEIEVQIRTHQMHHVAELGIAAHWKYKEGHLALSTQDIQQLSKLRAIFEAAHEVKDSTEFLETVKVDLFAMEIFVFTPQGDVKILPKGATALDFAYSIHTDVGNKTQSAKVDGRMVPLRYELKNGDRIEIITNEKQEPRPDWVKWVKTGRALSKIRRSIREEERVQSAMLGKELLEKELLKHNYSLTKMIKSGRILEISKHFGHQKPEQLYIAIGNGTFALSKVIKHVIPEVEKPTNPISSFINRFRTKSTSPVLISGHEGVMTTFAKCCNPLPGEEITGFITRGKGVSIHRSSCQQLLNSDTDRRITVAWHQESTSQHSSEIEIFCTDQVGLLAELGAVCKIQNVNISRLEANNIGDNKAKISLEVSVSDVSQLDKVMKNIQRIPGVLRLHRVQEKPA